MHAEARTPDFAARPLRRMLAACALVLLAVAVRAEPTKVILDTDPGVDDALAILFALGSPELEVAAITTSFGNAPVEQTTVNALKLLELSGRDVPVAPGADRPLNLAPPPLDDAIHGKDALGDVGLPAPKRSAVSQSAAELIVEVARREPGEITVIALGPLTNLAEALVLDPELPKLLRGVVVMGGAARVAGNMSPVAEFNVYNDPHAADVVFSSPWPITMVGLDVTEQVLLEDRTLESLAEASPPIGDFLYAATRVYRKFHDSLGITEGLYLHDLSAVAWVVDPTLFRTEAARVRVDTEGVATGQTVAVFGTRAAQWPAWLARPEVAVALGVDGPGVVDLLVASLGSATISGR